MKYVKVAALLLFLGINGYAHYIHYIKFEMMRMVIEQLYMNDMAIVDAFQELKKKFSRDL